MWELIASNRRKSLLLFAGMAVVLCVLGYLFGLVALPDGGGVIGLIVAIAIWVILSALSIFGGGDLILHLGGAKKVSSDVHPQLYNIVEEMKIASALPTMPKIYIVDSKAPNAFATGVNPENASVVVTAGLLARLNRDELQGVIAHEMAHIINRDVQFMTVSSIMLGAIVMLSQVFLRGMWFTGGGSSRRYRSEGNSGGPSLHPILIVLTIVLAILGPIFARILYFSISRKREYLADACAARFTRYPEGLASALEKISANELPLASANKVTAPMFIVNPLKDKQKRSLTGWSSTHPPIEHRVAILRSMSSGADLLTYQRAYSKVMGKPTMLIPGSGLKDNDKVDIRKAHPDANEKKSEARQLHDAMDAMRAVDGFAFMLCACGLKLKVPPEFKDTHLKCPRCKKENEVPKAQLSEMVEAATVVGAMVGALSGDGDNVIPSATLSKNAADPDASDAPLEYTRRSNTWESFTCGCGNLLQLSPAFDAKQMSCRKCQRVTRIL